jgi:hypothetical protein
MAVSLSISVQGLDELHERLNRVNPKTNPAWVRRSLLKAGELTQIISSRQMIIQSSRFRGPKGPRGGKGRMMSAGVHPSKLTSRHGGAGLVGSIRVNQTPLPWAIEVGTDKAYAHVHEEGGTFSVGSYSRTIASSTRSGGASMALVKSHSRTYPKRAFMAPGVEKAAKSFDRIFSKEWAKEMP